MAEQLRPLVAGNWKMNGLSRSIAELQALLADDRPRTLPTDLMLCPPATLLARFAEAARGGPIAIGAQDCHPEPSGAFTGDISAEMLKDSGAVAVIVGHSERRTYHAETDAVVQAKAKAARRAGLTAIVCVGETQEERDAGATIARIERQLEGSLPPISEALVIAYEPVWAIGTGLTPTPDDVAEVHQMIRNYLIGQDEALGARVRILYGGSVKPANARELLAVPDVNGALVGGASLKASDFIAIAEAYA